MADKKTSKPKTSALRKLKRSKSVRASTKVGAGKLPRANKAAKRVTATKKAVADDASRSKPKINFDKDKYNSVVRRAELKLIKLADLNYRVDDSYYNIEKSGEKTFNYGVHVSHVQYFEEDGTAVARIFCEVDAQLEGEKVLYIHANYDTLYGNLEDQDSDSVAIFMHRVSRFAVYPYFRQLVSQLAWSSDADLPILPVLKAGPIRTRAKE